MVAGVSDGFAEVFVGLTYWFEASRVKSFEVSSLRLSNSGNSTNARAQNKRAATTAKRILLRAGEPKDINKGYTSNSDVTQLFCVVGGI
jgi:hypothetical protein